MAEIMCSIRDVSTHLSKHKMGRTDQLLLWNDGFMNAITTRIMRQQNEFQSDHPYLWISGILHARILFMWLRCLFSMFHVILSYVGLYLQNLCIYHYWSIPQPFSLYSFIPAQVPPPRSQVPPALWSEGPARRKAVKRPCDLDPIGFPVEVSETPTYPRHPLSPQNERNSLINCWLGVKGMFHGSVGNFLHLNNMFDPVPSS